MQFGLFLQLQVTTHDSGCCIVLLPVLRLMLLWLQLTAHDIDAVLFSVMLVFWLVGMLLCINLFLTTL